MKQEIKYINLILLLILPILNSCKKETSCENCRSANDKNKPPIANAEVDQVITLPIDNSKRTCLNKLPQYKIVC